LLTEFLLEQLGRQRRSATSRSDVPHIVRLLRLAEEFQAKLDAGDVNHQAELARLYCMPRARVFQLMKLLSLPPEIKAFVHGLGPEVSPRYVTERRLRPLCAMAWSEQLAAAKALFPSFAAPASVSADYRGTNTGTDT
jgi:hypothetical protein